MLAQESGSFWSVAIAVVIAIIVVVGIERMAARRLRSAMKDGPPADGDEWPWFMRIRGKEKIGEFRGKRCVLPRW